MPAMDKLLISLALWSCCAGAAQAAQPVEDRSATVRYADLDLASSKGQATLQRRIAIAVRDVCSEAGQRTTAEHERRQACEADAWRQVRADLSRLALVSPAPGTATGELAMGSTWPSWH